MQVTENKFWFCTEKANFGVSDFVCWFISQKVHMCNSFSGITQMVECSAKSVIYNSYTPLFAASSFLTTRFSAQQMCSCRSMQVWWLQKVAQELLTFLSCSEIPPELTRMAKGGEVNLDMEDHRTEEYVKPKATVKPFGGEGNRLGR